MAASTVRLSTPSERAKHNREERQRKARRRAENRRIIAEEKARGCSLCPRRDIPFDELHFHHRDQLEKKDCVANLVSRSTEALTEEISKTQLICRRCHEEHHQQLLSESKEVRP